MINKNHTKPLEIHHYLNIRHSNNMNGWCGCWCEFRIHLLSINVYIHTLQITRAADYLNQIYLPVINCIQAESNHRFSINRNLVPIKKHLHFSSNKSIFFTFEAVDDSCRYTDIDANLPKGKFIVVKPICRFINILHLNSQVSIVP